MRYARKRMSDAKQNGISWRKFGNRPTGGHASKKEAKRAAELRLLESTGQIEGLAFQVPFTLIPAQYINGKCVERSCKYIADAVYYEEGKQVVEDVKGMKTNVYRLKKKMMLAMLGIQVRET